MQDAYTCWACHALPQGILGASPAGCSMWCLWLIGCLILDKLPPHEQLGLMGSMAALHHRQTSCNTDK